MKTVETTAVNGALARLHNGKPARRRPSRSYKRRTVSSFYSKPASSFKPEGIFGMDAESLRLCAVGGVYRPKTATKVGASFPGTSCHTICSESAFAEFQQVSPRNPKLMCNNSGSVLAPCEARSIRGIRPQWERPRTEMEEWCSFRLLMAISLPLSLDSLRPTGEKEPDCIGPQSNS